MPHVPTSAIKPKRHFWRWVLAFLLVPLVFWYVAAPRVIFHFSDKGQGRLGYILNVQNSISKGGIYPGETTGDVGHIFPSEKFFFEFDWNNDGRSHCIRVKPKWPEINVYIGPDGAIDRSRTDGSVIDECVPPR